MTSYICSKCGFDRNSPRVVAEHIVKAHDGTGRIMEAEEGERSESVLYLVLYRIAGGYQTVKRFYRKLRRRR